MSLADWTSPKSLAEWWNGRKFRSISGRIESMIAARVYELAQLHEQRVQLATNQAIAFAESQVRDVRLGLEQRAQLATNQAIAFAESQVRDVRVGLEQRAQLATNQAIAFALAENGSSTRRLVEERAQWAANEAKAYADLALGNLSRSVAAANMIVMRAEKRLRATEKVLDDKADKSTVDTTISNLDQSLADLRSINAARADFQRHSEDVLNEFKTRFENIENDLGGVNVINLRSEFLNWLEKTERAENTLSEFVTRFENIETDLGGVNVNNVHSEFLTRFENIERDLSSMPADYHGQLRNAEQRIEFIRSEVMYEMQASLFKASVDAPQLRDAPRIVNQARVDAMRESGLRLNLGCGHIQLDDYLNVDGRELPGVDIVADATEIPFKPNELSEIRSSHLVEHFTSHILERVVLPYWYGLLKPGGTLTTIAPDGAEMLKGVNSGEMAFEDFREVLFGGQDYDGDFHYNLITPATWTESLKRAGFTDITEEYVGKRNGKCYEFKILARKP